MYYDKDNVTVFSSENNNANVRRTLSLPGVSSEETSQENVCDSFDDDLVGWRHTMEDLVEVSENEDSLQSRSSGRMLLARAARSIPVRPTPGYTLDHEHLYDELDSMSADAKKAYRKHYMKNLIILAVAFMMFFSSYLSIRNLQSSINDIDGLGLYALCSVYAMLFFGSLSSKFIVERLRPKKTLLLACISYLLYAASNLYPSFYTIIPASLLVGFCIANTWTAQATYLSNTASIYAGYAGKTTPQAVSYFNGIFYAFFHMGSIIGNGISSLILTNRDHDNVRSETLENFGNESHTAFLLSANDSPAVVNVNDSLESLLECGANFDYAHAEPSARSVSFTARCLLLSTYLGIMIVGTIILLFCLDPLEGDMVASQNSLAKQTLSVLKFFGNSRVILLLPFMAYSILQGAFMFGEYTKVNKNFCF